MAAVLLWIAAYHPVVAKHLAPFGRRRPVLSIVIACALGAVIFGVSWHFYLRGRAAVPKQTGIDTTQVSTPPSVPFRVGVRSMAVSDAPGELTLFMVGYRSMYGDTASPVFCLANLEIVNGRGFQVTVDRVGLAVGDNADGPWVDLVQIPLRGRALYMLGAQPGAASQKKVEYPHGTYRLSSPMKAKALNSAALLTPTPILEAELLKPIQPHDTAAGWAAFDSPRRSTKAVPNYVRITVRDTTGVLISSVIESPRPQARDAEHDVQPGIIETAGMIVNIRKFHVRRYSDPYPQRLKPKG